MRRLWLFALLAPLTLALRTDGAAQEPVQAQLKIVTPPAPAAAQANGDLYFISLSQEDAMDFLAHGFERAIMDNAKPMFKEIHGQVIKGRDCNKPRILEALDELDGKVKANDVVMLFIACHGTCDKSGESIFHVRGGGKIRPREVKSRLGKLPCQSIVMNDACCSGNWHKEFEGDPMPENISVLTCCQWNQTSINEFDIALFEGFFGKADFNKDGIVDLDELMKYTGLRLREVVGGLLVPTLHKAKNLTRPLQLTKVNPKIVTVVHQKEVFTGVVEDRDGDEFEVHLLGFTQKGRKAGYGGDRVKTRYNRSNIILPTDGDALMVKKSGGWFPAVKLGKTGDDIRVRFIGSDGEDTFAAEDVRHLFGLNPSEEIRPGLFRKR